MIGLQDIIASTATMTDAQRQMFWFDVPGRQRELMEAGQIVRTAAHQRVFDRIYAAATACTCMFAIVAPSGQSNNGVGKSTDAAELLVRMRNGHNCRSQGQPVGHRLIDADELLAQVDGRFAGDTNRWLANWSKPWLLAIDECDKAGIAAAGWTGAERLDRFRALMNRRYRAGAAEPLATLLITNSDQVEFEEIVGRSVLERIDEIGAVIVPTWPKLRMRGSF